MNSHDPSCNRLLNLSPCRATGTVVLVAQFKVHIFRKRLNSPGGKSNVPPISPTFRNPCALSVFGSAHNTEKQYKDG